MKDHHFSQFIAAYRDKLDHMRLYDFLLTVSNKGQCAAMVNIYLHYRDVLVTIPASGGAHQAWEGGYKDHLASICRFGWKDFRSDGGMLRPLPYRWDDFMVAVFCHDAEKLAKYARPTDPRFTVFHEIAQTTGWEEVKWLMLDEWQSQFGLVIDENIRNAIKYTHGEGADYRNGQRVMLPLAAAVGNADRKSARMYPFEGQGCG